MPTPTDYLGTVENTPENRSAVAKLILEEEDLIVVSINDYNLTVRDKFKESLHDALVHAWSEDDDEWHEACKSFRALLYENGMNLIPEEDTDEDTDEDGIPMPRPIPFPKDWPPRGF